MPRGNGFVPNCLNWFSKFKHHAKKTLSEFAVNALQRTSNYFALGECSEATKHLYLTELRYLFSHYCDLRPSLLTQKHAEDYLIYLATTLKCSKTKTKMASQSISFFFKFVLKREYHAPKIFNTAHCSKLPAVMSVDEVRNIILSVKNLKHRTLLSLVYSTGMRLQELCNLKIEHIDSKQMVIKVVAGKGKKDRMLPLSPLILTELRAYFRLYKPEVYLFNGSVKGSKYNPRTVQHILSKAIVNLGLESKNFSFHTLRHSFATHLYDNGTDLITIQHLMGHGHISQSMQYLHISTKRLANIVNPYDVLSANTDNKIKDISCKQ
ncbi:MAG: tyrosine-type recombinase/integrase [Chitinophagaceae bacterium]